jgi:multicomponent Na+:H+ antiporter subunit G
MLIPALILATLAVLAGTAFSLIGVIGFIRLPDVYTRLHATGKVSVFGVVLLLVAATLLTPLGAGKAAVLILLLILGAPTASHALASTAWRTGIKPRRLIRNDLGPPENDHASEHRPTNTKDRKADPN